MPAAAPDLRDPWWARLPVIEEPGRPPQRTTVAVLSSEFPAHAVIDLPDDRRPPGWQMAVRADVGGGAVHAVDVAMPGAPLCWYVELAEPDATPAATTLVAFSDTRFPEGTVLDAARARAAGVSGTHQVAAVRWWPVTGLVHQLYVVAGYRRRGLASKLVQAAFGVQYARGLPDIHGDGRRTELGEAWRQALPEAVSARMAGWSEVMPPMTPALSA
jgi:GNAT superfamily N-acetyltransferase